MINESDELDERELRKLIERTCKHDAYQRVFLWIRSGRKDFDIDSDRGAWFAHQKMMGHREYLDNHTHRYDYGTGQVVKKKKDN